VRAVGARGHALGAAGERVAVALQGGGPREWQEG
jgi:hypothetical protein